MESAVIAAWLHDVGYIAGDTNHEQKAADQSKDLLLSWGASHRKIMEVSEAILATKIPQQPKSLIGKVLCDADLFHLSTEECIAQSDKLREEWEAVGQKSMSDEEWLKNNLSFLENHRYHTPYGRAVLQIGKKKKHQKNQETDYARNKQKKNIINSRMN
ncbi:MAG: hypothetical protein ABIR06_15745 [Cyclobacteriaceae bacterium]